MADLNATWTDITDVLLSHDHPDHTASLNDVAAQASHATIWGNAPISARALTDGNVVRGLTVLATPGHTAGHVSLHHEGSALLIGDIVGSQGAVLSRAPAPFTADAEEAERSLRRIAHISFERLLTAHGPELADPATALHTLLDGAPTA